MSEPVKQLPPQISEAIRQGNLVQAIKLLRSSGIGLKEAKDVVDTYTRPNTASSFTAPVPGGPLPGNVVEALEQGNKIEAIRRLRESSGLGLKEAKDAVDAYNHTHRNSGLSPGQVGPSSGRWGWTFAIAALLVLGYLMLRRMA